MWYGGGFREVFWAWLKDCWMLRPRLHRCANCGGLLWKAGPRAVYRVFIIHEVCHRRARMRSYEQLRR